MTFIDGYTPIWGNIFAERLFPEAITELRTATEISGGSSYYLGPLAHACGAAGDAPGAQIILDQLKKTSVSSYVSAYSIAEIYLGLGDRNQTFEWLEKAYEERARALSLIKIEPKLDPLRSDPRFQNLFRRMNFPQ